MVVSDCFLQPVALCGRNCCTLLLDAMVADPNIVVGLDRSTDRGTRVSLVVVQSRVEQQHHHHHRDRTHSGCRILRLVGARRNYPIDDEQHPFGQDAAVAVAFLSPEVVVVVAVVVADYQVSLSSPLSGVLAVAPAVAVVAVFVALDYQKCVSLRVTWHLAKRIARLYRDTVGDPPVVHRTTLGW